MFTLIKASNGVSYLTSDLLGCTNAFATRIGGVSRAEHTKSLNLAFGRGDDEAVVFENLSIFSDAVGIDPESVISCPQIHSADVIIADESMCGEGYFTKAHTECDGYTTNSRRVTLGIKTADCVPILMHDPIANVIGAVHAGWRGTASGIASQCINKMCELGADSTNIRTAIGPAIHACCYEVGKDFFESVTSLMGREIAERFILPSGEKYRADIVGMNRHILLLAGVRDENIDICSYCTCCNPELFFSHRFSNGKRGTMLSIIAL